MKADFPLLNVEGYNGRAVYRAMLADLRERDSRKIANNTYLWRGETCVCVRYHATHIVRVESDGTTTINDAGWNTLTTRRRIKDWLDEYVNGGAYWTDGALFVDSGGRDSYHAMLAMWDSAIPVMRRRAYYAPDVQRSREYHPWTGSGYDTTKVETYAWSERGRLLGYNKIEEMGALCGVSLPVTIGPRGAIRREPEARRVAKARVLPLSVRCPEVPRAQPFFKILRLTPGPQEVSIPLSADIRPREEEMIIGYGPFTGCETRGGTVRAAGKLEPCARGIHFCTLDQLPDWTRTALGRGDSGAGIVIRRVVPVGKVYSGNGKCFARGVAVGETMSGYFTSAMLGYGADS